MHLSYMHRRMSAQKPQKIQHAIGNDPEPNRRPRRLANKLRGKTQDRRQKVEFRQPEIFSRILLTPNGWGCIIYS